MKIGGIIAYIGAEAFWKSLSKQEQRQIKLWYTENKTSFGYKSDPKIIDHGKIEYSSATKDGFFGGWANWAISAKLYDFAEKMLLYAEENISSALQYHFTCNSFISLYYKQRNTRPDAIEKTKEYCLKDINQYSRYAKILHEDGKVQCPAFKRLCIIYEKEENYAAAIEICKKAIKYELHDGTKADFSGRLERLLRKEKS
ncbi:MAG: hypothetical protein ACLS6Q_01340 [Christensenellaceae bacterium]